MEAAPTATQAGDMRFDDDELAVPQSKGEAKQPFVIGVGGGTASGKSTVCNMIIQQLHDHRVVLVNQDSFYRGLTAEELENVGEYNFDHPDAFDTEQLLDCLEKLKSCLPIQIPVYDFKRHQRSLDMVRKVNAADVIILEGILVFHDARVRGLMNMKIFVDTGLSIFFLHFGCLSQYLLSNSC
jgi:uridine kinase